MRNKKVKYLSEKFKNNELIYGLGKLSKLFKNPGKQSRI